MKVVLFTKPGCHLCEPVRQVILAGQKRLGFEYEERNILDDDGDFDRYKDDIPVVTVDGREIARHRMTMEQLVAALV